MGRSTKDAWLKGPGDLTTAEVEDVPVEGMSVKVRGLPAAYSNQAISEALKSTQQGRDTVSKVDKHELEVLQFVHGVVEPVFTQAEARQIAELYGPAWAKVIAKIDELSGLDKEAVDEANLRFQERGASPNGSTVGDAAPAGGAGPDLPPRTGGEAREKRAGVDNG